jgi:hypothetical protein
LKKNFDEKKLSKLLTQIKDEATQKYGFRLSNGKTPLYNYLKNINFTLKTEIDTFLDSVLSKTKDNNNKKLADEIRKELDNAMNNR